MSALLYYVGDEAAVVAANAQINSNCGFPNSQANTWGIPTRAYAPLDFWFVSKPPPQGMIFANGTVLSQATMIANVTGVTESTSDPSWWPPEPPAVKTPALDAKSGLDVKTPAPLDVKSGTGAAAPAPLDVKTAAPAVKTTAPPAVKSNPGTLT